jgi:N-methylhydantoinase A
MLVADVIKDYSLTVMRNQQNTTPEDLTERFGILETSGIEDLAAEGFPHESVLLERYLDMRYEGQSYEIIVPFEGDYIENFHSLHEKTYGYRNKDKVVEIVNLRLRTRGIPDKPSIEKAGRMKDTIPEKAFLGNHEVLFDRALTHSQVFARDRLLSGNRLGGPAILVEYSSTIVIPPFASAFVDEYGNVVMEIT